MVVVVVLVATLEVLVPRVVLLHDNAAKQTFGAVLADILLKLPKYHFSGGYIPNRAYNSFQGLSYRLCSRA